MPAKLKGWGKFERDLDAFLDTKRIHTAWAKKHLKTVVRVIIGTAEAGIGPDGERYEPYSESYKKQLGLGAMRGRSGLSISRKQRRTALAAGKSRRVVRAAGRKRWLRGMGQTGVSGGMLDPGNFSYELRGKRLFLIWEGQGDQVIYGPVHQGTKYGGEDYTIPGKGGAPRVPPRPWLHFDNKRNATAAIKAYQETINAMAGQFSAGHTPG